MSVRTARRRRRWRLVAGLAATVGLAASSWGALVALTSPPLGAAPAPAPAPAPGSTIRVAHFSPDTPPMDVYAAGFDGTEALVLPKLGFGEVSQYMSLPAGSYAFSMRPEGAPGASAAVLRVSAELVEGGTYTFAAFGRRESLETDLLTDDLTAPAAGQARVRIIQAAGDSGPVDVTTTASPLFTQAARLGTVGTYASVPAGAVDVTASADGVDDVTRRLDLATGTVSSVVVLDEPTSGGLQVVRVTDGTGTPGVMATPSGMPAGGVDTGGGSTASVRSGVGARDGDRGGVPLTGTVAGAAAVLTAAVALAAAGAARRTAGTARGPWARRGTG
jgi:Domain of unknown function (DUF4397)